MNLSDQELTSVSGGAIKIALSKYLIVGGIATFVIGLLNGYLRPLTCKSDK